MAVEIVQTDPSVRELIIIGVVGGGFAAFSATLMTWFTRWIRDLYLMESIYNWLKANTRKGSDGEPEFRSTRVIASFTNLTEDQVRDLCSRSRKIFLSTGSAEGMWSIHSREPKKLFGLL